jgi:hypothetical protein
MTMPDPDKRVCWKCGTEYGDSVRICVRCGIDLVTGVQLGGPGDDTDPEGALGALAFLDSWMPGVFRPLLMLASIAVGMVGVWVTLFALSLGMVVALGMGAGGLIIYGHAVGWMLLGRFATLTTALSEIESKQWALFFSLMAVPVTIVLTVVTRAGS